MPKEFKLDTILSVVFDVPQLSSFFDDSGHSGLIKFLVGDKDVDPTMSAETARECLKKQFPWITGIINDPMTVAARERLNSMYTTVVNGISKKEKANVLTIISLGWIRVIAMHHNLDYVYPVKSIGEIADEPLNEK